MPSGPLLPKAGVPVRRLAAQKIDGPFSVAGIPLVRLPQSNASSIRSLFAAGRWLIFDRCPWNWNDDAFAAAGSNCGGRLPCAATAPDACSFGEVLAGSSGCGLAGRRLTHMDQSLDYRRAQRRVARRGRARP